MKIEINHSEYPKRLRSLPTESLYFIIKDAGEALRVNPGGDKAGYYSDEIHYAAMELKRREGGRV